MRLNVTDPRSIQTSPLPVNSDLRTVIHKVSTSASDGVCVRRWPRSGFGKRQACGWQRVELWGIIAIIFDQRTMARPQAVAPCLPLNC